MATRRIDMSYLQPQIPKQESLFRLSSKDRKRRFKMTKSVLNQNRTVQEIQLQRSRGNRPVGILQHSAYKSIKQVVPDRVKLVQKNTASLPFLIESHKIKKIGDRAYSVESREQEYKKGLDHLGQAMLKTVNKRKSTQANTQVLENRIKMLQESEKKEQARMKRLEDQMNKFSQIRQSHFDHKTMQQKSKIQMEIGTRKKKDQVQRFKRELEHRISEKREEILLQNRMKKEAVSFELDRVRHFNNDCKTRFGKLKIKEEGGSEYERRMVREKQRIKMNKERVRKMEIVEQKLLERLNDTQSRRKVMYENFIQKTMGTKTMREQEMSYRDDSPVDIRLQNSSSNFQKYAEPSM
ncbi:unnamed protein product [Moneuplotes crassus]|uniref:Uncharacterized protein n=1 Tax=Euplotes crassus TaxID=5936 RepID=A0AAD1ULI2_EUPCR|nr:unnamed protein product [Moneuplotes crassus]